jgi:hypothetical protein
MATFNVIKADNSIIEENISQEAANLLLESEVEGQEFSYFWFPVEEEIRTKLTDQHGEKVRFVKANPED